MGFTHVTQCGGAGHQPLENQSRHTRSFLSPMFHTRGFPMSLVLLLSFAKGGEHAERSSLLMSGAAGSVAVWGKPCGGLAVLPAGGAPGPPARLPAPERQLPEYSMHLVLL